MKSTSLIASSVAILASQALFALEGPPDLAPPPPAVDIPAAPTARQAPLKFTPLAEPKKLPLAPATAFLGVVTSDIPEILAEHLRLQNGIGIVVRSQLPEGPAAKAGLAVNDVITRMAGQAITSPQDLSQLVASKQPGERVALEFIHRGETTSLEIVLGTRPETTAAVEPPSVEQLNLDALPKELADRVRGAIQGNLGKLDSSLEDEKLMIPPAMEEALQALQQRLQLHTGTTLRMKDDHGSVELKTDNGHKQITLRDPQNQIVFSGPWNTEADKAAASVEARQRIADLQIDGSREDQASQPKRSQPLQH
jgi:serine protease Do